MSNVLLSRIFLTSFSRVSACRANIFTSLCASQAACSGRFNNKRNLPIDQSIGRAQYSTGASLVLNKDDEKKIVNLYKDLATYDEEQVLDLMTYKGQLQLDATHLAICMKRLYASYVESDRKKDFVEGIKDDPRFLKLMNNLMVSARHLTAPVICDMVKFAHILSCPLPHFYGLLKLCMNVVSDVAVDKIAELSNVLVGAVDNLEERIKCRALTEKDFEWLPLLANQMELMMKCISILADSKGHQLQILDMKSRIDLLLAFGTELPSFNNLLIEMIKNFEEFSKSPEELMRAIPALLICLSTYPDLSPLQPTSTSLPSILSESPSPLWVSQRINQFKDLLVTVDGSVSSKLSKGIRVEDKYDELMKGFEDTLMRPQTDQSLETKAAQKDLSIKLLIKLISRTLDAYCTLEEPLLVSKQTIKLLLGACVKYLNVDTKPHFSLRCVELAKLVSEAIEDDLASDNQRGLWNIQEQLDVLCSFGEMEYFPSALSAAVVRNIVDVPADEKDVKRNLSSYLSLLTNKQFIGLLETIATLDLYEQNSPEPDSLVAHSQVVLKIMLDHVEEHQEKFFSHGSSLDVRMKLASHMLVNGRRVDSMESILKDLNDLDLKQVSSSETHLNTAKIFIHCSKDTPLSEYSAQIHTKLFHDLKELSHAKSQPIDKLVNKLWPGRVTRSVTPFCGYLINLPVTNGEATKSVILNFHSKGCFWRNTTQLKPVCYHIERSIQLQDHRVVPIDIRRLMKMSDREEYLKYRVEQSHEFQDLLNIV